VKQSIDSMDRSRDNFAAYPIYSCDRTGIIRIVSLPTPHENLAPGGNNYWDKPQVQFIHQHCVSLSAIYAFKTIVTIIKRTSILIQI